MITYSDVITVTECRARETCDHPVIDVGISFERRILIERKSYIEEKYLST